jgi:CelD/BcsL family acetyltransferase involved in cellulose biosynthesis/RimJ/RimL family protein N-acetyltransferase
MPDQPLWFCPRPRQSEPFGSRTNPVVICVTTDTEADALLSAESFRAAWNELYCRCPWATVFQDVDFVTTWYGTYTERFRPVIIRETNSAGELTGLLTLALSVDSRRLIVAGGHQAEYHTWLASAVGDSSFIEAALRELRRRFPNRSLVFKYLPPRTPLDWTSPGRFWGRRCRLQQFSDPLWRVDDGSKLKAVLYKNKRPTTPGLNRLKELGDFHFEQITDLGGLKAVFGPIMTYYNFRHGAIYNTSPFLDDPLKERFHLRLMEIPDLLHVTVLKAGGQVVAAHVGAAGRGIVHGGFITHSPFVARSSPGIIQWLMLGEHMAKTGFHTLDLTPGGDWYKERLATDHEDVHVLKLFFHRWQALAHDANEKCVSLSKRVLQVARVQPQAVKAFVRKARHTRLADLPVKVLRRTFNLVRRLVHTPELRIYVFRRQDFDKIVGAVARGSPLNGAPAAWLMSRDSLDDLLAFRPAEAWQDRQRFLAEALTRIEKAHHMYTRVEEGRLVHYGWLIDRQKKAFFGEVQRAYEFPDHSAVLYDYWTHPAARGRGLYQSSLRQMLNDAFAIEGTQQAYIGVLADNGPSRHAIEKTGFVYECSLYKESGMRKMASESGTTRIPTPSSSTNDSKP